MKKITPSDKTTVEVTYYDLFKIYAILGKINDQLRTGHSGSIWSTLADHDDHKEFYGKYFLGKTPNEVVHFINHGCTQEELLEIFDQLFNKDYVEKETLEEELKQAKSKVDELQKEYDSKYVPKKYKGEAQLMHSDLPSLVVGEIYDIEWTEGDKLVLLFRNGYLYSTKKENVWFLTKEEVK